MIQSVQSLDSLNVLAQTALAASDGSSGPNRNPFESISSAFERLDILNHPDQLLDGLQGIHILWASIFTVIGLLCVLNGYRWHKFVIVLCALLGGLGLGHLLGKQIGESPIVVGSLGLLCAIIATPLKRFSVAILGGLTGAFLGANTWTAISDAPDAHMAGAAMGFIALALLSFIIFRMAIVIFTSIGGAALAVLGGVGLLLHVEAWEPAVRDSLSANNLVIPLLVLVAAVSGFVLQESQIYTESRAQSE